MPKPKQIRDPLLEKTLAGYIKDPSTIDVFSAKDKAYSKRANEALHGNLPASVVKNIPVEEQQEILLNVSSVQDQDYVSKSFGAKSRIVHKPVHAPKPVKADPALEKALAGYVKDTSKIDVFSAEDKVYSQQVNFGLSHHMPASCVKKDTPEQARGMAPKGEVLLNVSSWEDQEFVSRSFGPKSRS